MPNDAVISIKYKNKKLIKSGTFITFGDGETVLDIENEYEKITVIFDFEEERSKPRGTEAVVIDSQTLKVVFTNYGNTGGATSKPWLFAALGEMDLYLLYKITPMTNSVHKEVVYSFYLEGA